MISYQQDIVGILFIGAPCICILHSELFFDTLHRYL